MRWPAVVVALLATACAAPAAVPRDDDVHVVDLNAAMGYRAGPGDPLGTDPTTEDLNHLADDLMARHADVANLQEMALPAANQLREILATRTGDTWQVNFAWAGVSTYYAGKHKNERPTWVDAPTGDAQLIRLGDGIMSQRPLTLDNLHDDQGIVLPSGGRAFLGTELTTSLGVLNIFTTHLALARQVPDPVRASDVRRIQETTESSPTPTIVTGDLNQPIDQPDATPLTAAAIRAYPEQYGYTDVAKDKGPTANQKGTYEGTLRIDYLFTRGVSTKNTVRFVSHESDHWGLATTLTR